MAPDYWKPEEKQLVERINRGLEDIYRRYGRLRLDDLSESTRAYLSGFATLEAFAKLSGAVEALRVRIESLDLMDALPVGTWLPTSGGLPSGGKWMVPEGQALDPTRYPEARAIFGASLPDIRGRTLVSQDVRQGVFAGLHQAGGEASHQLTEAEVPSHAHAIPALQGSAGGGEHSHQVPLGTIQVEGVVSSGQAAAVYAPTGNGTVTAGGGGHSHPVVTEAATTGAAGGGQAHGNLQPYLTVRYMVKVLP